MRLLVEDQDYRHLAIAHQIEKDHKEKPKWEVAMLLLVEVEAGHQ